VIVAFGRFWYGYTWATTGRVRRVFIGLIVSGVLTANPRRRLVAIPVIVVVMLGISLRRASNRTSEELITIAGASLDC